jgi:hypothetical protein
MMCVLSVEELFSVRTVREKDLLPDLFFENTGTPGTSFFLIETLGLTTSAGLPPKRTIPTRKILKSGGTRPLPPDFRIFRVGIVRFGGSPAEVVRPRVSIRKKLVE